MSGKRTLAEVEYELGPLLIEHGWQLIEKDYSMLVYQLEKEPEMSLKMNKKYFGVYFNIKDCKAIHPVQYLKKYLSGMQLLTNKNN